MYFKKVIIIFLIIILNLDLSMCILIFHYVTLVIAGIYTPYMVLHRLISAFRECMHVLVQDKVYTVCIMMFTICSAFPYIIVLYIQLVLLVYYVVCVC